MSERIRVVIVEDQALVRAGFRALIDDCDDMEVVGEAASGVEGVAVVAEQRPDVALVDVRMPGMDGVTATRLMTTDAGSPPRVIVLTAFDDEDTVFGALRAGASGFLLKDSPPAALLGAIRTVVAGDALIDPEVTRMVIERALRPAPAGGPRPTADVEAEAEAQAELAQLTPRERDVLRLVGAGLSNDEITRQLVVSPATTKTHIRHLLAKTGSRDRAQLVVLAYESGLVTPQR